MIEEFKRKLTPTQRETFASLTSPVKIQAYLDDTPYTADSFNRSPLRIIDDRRAHCLEGGLFAAAVLRRIGIPPQIVDLLPEPGTDDDHVLAISIRSMDVLAQWQNPTLLACATASWCSAAYAGWSCLISNLKDRDFACHSR